MIARLLTCAALTAFAIPAQDTVTVLRGARILPASGPAIDSGVIVLAGGKIQTLGDANTSIPNGARVIDCAGLTITPGLVDAGTVLGTDSSNSNEEGEEVTPHMRVVDALDPADRRFAQALRGGVTTVQINPGNRNVVGGFGAIVKTHGETVAQMLVRDESGMRLTMGAEPSRGNLPIRGGRANSIFYRRPTTRMGVIWSARKAFYDAKAYKERKTVDDGSGDTLGDPAMEALVRVLDGEVAMHTTARSEADIRTALRLAAEFGYQTLIEEATEAWRVVDELKAAEVDVLISAPSRTIPGQGAAIDGAELKFLTLNLLAEAEVRFAIQTGADFGTLPLIHEATFAIRNGLDPVTALAAITTVPARILGIGDQVGSLAPGLDADLVLWSGSPFEPTSRIDTIYLAGEVVLP